MKLNYKAVTPEGKSLQGIIEARNIEEAAKYLRGKNIIPIHIVPKKDFEINLSFGKSRKQLVFFTRQLSSMISAGLTLMQALRTLQAQMQQGELKKIIASVIADIEDGNTFADSLQNFPKYFDPIYISLIRAAESSGLLDKVLARLADNLEKEEKLRSSIKGALLYPVIVVIGMIIVMAVMMIVVIPELTPIYKQLNVTLPFTTQVVIAISNFMIYFWYLLIAGVVAFYFAFRSWRKTEAGTTIWDSIILKLPIFGKLIHDSIL